jgi:hypothetical protein
MSSTNKVKFLDFCDTSQYMDSDIDKISEFLGVPTVENDVYQCKYQEIVERFRYLMSFPEYEPSTIDEKKIYSSFIGWMLRAGKRRTSLDYALQACSDTMRYPYSKGKLARLGDILGRHYFNEIPKDQCEDILSSLYEWMNVSNYKECLEKIDSVSTTNCKILKVRALVVIAQAILM